MSRFEGMNAQVLGVSVDSVPGLKAWAESLGGISYPLLSDFWPHGRVAELYGVLRQEGTSERAIFLIDSEGTIRYIDIHDINDLPDNEVLFGELAKLAEPAVAQRYEREKQEAELPRGGVVMYCTTFCPDCKQAAAWLDAHGVQYRRVDVSQVPGGTEQVRKWTGGPLITPIFDVDGTIVVDWDKVRLREALEEHGLVPTP